MTLEERIKEAINATCAEQGSNTPDFILAAYLMDCLAAFDRAVTARRTWYSASESQPQENEQTFIRLAGDTIPLSD